VKGRSDSLFVGLLGYAPAAQQSAAAAACFLLRRTVARGAAPAAAASSAEISRHLYTRVLLRFTR